MLSTSGFGWDWIHNKLMVDSEDVWSNYVKANKDAACYRHNVTKFWDSISLVFSKDHATGIGARTAAESVAEMAAENVNNVNIESAVTSSTQTAYDILIADDRKFKALMALPERMKNKWILKQISQ
uniref:Myb/SANT-like domain-containing protein n=1 Tax=Aegilops tauschii TaxID=37682 RepID=M8CDD0_AEGTA